MNTQWLPMPRYNLRKYLIKDFLKSEKLTNKSCLEIGYGAGDMLILFARMGLDVHGYDFSSDAYADAFSRVNCCAPSLRKKITLLTKEHDIYSQSYDYVIALEVIEHIEDDVVALKKYKNYLRPNGKLILSVPAHKSKWGINDLWAGHVRRYEKAELVKKITNAGFKVTYIWNYGFPISLILDPLLHKSRLKEVATGEKKNIEARTKESGIKRKKTPFHRLISSNAKLLLPFCVLQKFFLNTDLGSSYISVAEKKV